MTSIDFPKHFNSLHTDGVSWKASRLWSAAENEHDKAEAIEEITTMLVCIANETTRTGYIDRLQNENKIKHQLLKKSVKNALEKADRQKKEKIHRAKLESQFNDPEEVGIHKNFKGNIYDALKYGVYEHDGTYWTVSGKKNLSNFKMRILYHTVTDDDTAHRLIHLVNSFGFEALINISTDDFVSVGTFKKIISRQGNFIFKGNDADLSNLQELLQKDEQHSKYISTPGYHRGGFWAWANGITPVNTEDDTLFYPTDEQGIIEHAGRKYFIPMGSKIFNDKYNKFMNEKKFAFQPQADDIDFKAWNTMFLTAYGSKAIAATLHYVGAIFRDIVLSKLQRYPILNLFGPPAAGKGRMAESLMSMFGERQTQVMLGGASTPVGFMRKMGQFANAYVWLDEFKNSIPPKVQESIKNIFDGIGYERGMKTNDLQTESTPVLSSAILSGQELPTGEAALFTRIILLIFEDGKNRPEAMKAAFEKLKQLENKAGFSWITATICKYRSLVEKNFERYYKEIHKDLNARLVNPVIEDRFIDNISILLAFRKIFNGVIDFAFTYEDAEKYMIENIQHHQALKMGNDDISKFWQVVEHLFNDGQIKEEVEFKLEDGFIYICLQKVHPLYHKEMIARRDPNILGKSTLEHYLRLDKQVYDGEPRKRFKLGGNSWCFKMRYAKLNIDLIMVEKQHNETENDHKYRLDRKYESMGVVLPEEEVKKPDDELPF